MNRLVGKLAIGGGMQSGEAMGDGRITAVIYSCEGAKVLIVDINLVLVEEVCAMIVSEGGAASAFQVDIKLTDACKAMVDAVEYA